MVEVPLLGESSYRELDIKRKSSVKNSRLIRFYYRINQQGIFTHNVELEEPALKGACTKNLHAVLLSRSPSVV